jgi:AcrR family transcriptional regulator
MPEASDRQPRPAPGLEREKVVKSALELLNEAGFDGLTLRRLAAKLGVKASALYWHFENKQDLINQLATAIIDNEFASADPAKFMNASWQDLLRGMGNGMRSALSRYRDGSLIIAKADLTGAASFKGRDLMVESLLNAGFSGRLAITAMFSVGRFTLGCVFEEQADPRPKDEMQASFKQRLQEMQTTRPAMARALEDYSEGEAMNADLHFKQGLEIIIAGVEKQLTDS